jgi:diaminohydroxyphosphoribosylaminopyrimidine deaminase/5-amino-6-(5-phosphoribosylamino)uracil reductase
VVCPRFSFTDADRAHMRRALELAARGLYTTTPNPRVGCVIVRDGAVIGEGWHERAGAPHAEVNALADARARGHDPRGATAYVTLEPCNHTGRTPPCTDAVIAAGLARVVVAALDPNPQAAHGAARLSAAGIAVETGLLAEAAAELNIGFVSRVTRGRPWVRLKAAASLDGRTALAGGESQWITGEDARADGHRWRARACAVLTGIGTVLQDDPRLDVRAVATPRQPRRVIVDRHAQTPVDARVLAGANALIVTNGARNPRWPAGIEVLELADPDGRVDLPALMRELADRGVNELHVEAGGKLNGALLHAGLVDELLLYLAPCLLGDPARGIAELAGGGLARLGDRLPLSIHAVDRVGEDLRVIARIVEKA